MAFQATHQYRMLCRKYQSIVCEVSGKAFANIKTTQHPEIADHPMQRADVVFGTEADWGDYGDIRHGVLEGFGIELTKMLCAQLGKACAIVTVPSETMWASDYTRLGWPGNPLSYAGEGHHDRWFHCSMNAFNIIARQQSITFTHPYTDKFQDMAGFVVPDSAVQTFPTDAGDNIVGMIRGWATTTYFLSQLGIFVFNPASITQYTVQKETWAALTSGFLNAVYVDLPTANEWLAQHDGYQVVHATAGWSNGVSYGCHPKYGDIVAALNRGLQHFKTTPEYAALCDQYPSIACDTSSTAYANVKTLLHPEIADHPFERADIVIGIDEDFPEHSYIRNGVLGGFDVEFTKAVCAEIGKTCAIIPAPWQAARPKGHPRLGWPQNTKDYPGEGFQSRWYHCTSSTSNLITRQQSTPFSHPYTDPLLERAGFIVPDSAASSFPADAASKTVALLEAWASTNYFKSQVGSVFHPLGMVEFDSLADVWEAFTAEEVHAVYIYEMSAETWLSSANGYRLVHSKAGWSRGLGYQCHPEYGDVVATLNKGITAFKATAGYRRLCGRYPTVNCDCPGVVVQSGVVWGRLVWCGVVWCAEGAVTKRQKAGMSTHGYR